MTGSRVRIHSWGGMSGEVRQLSQPAFSSEIGAELCGLSRRGGETCLIVGNLRSYGDEILNPHGRYIRTTRCDRVLGVDAEAGTVTAESGVTLHALQRRLERFGFMLPVTPGTAQLTLGGAIANDVHGKNHHATGSFGCFVERFELVRSSGEQLLCSRQDNPQHFAASIGGMGLTGAITWATVKIRRIGSPLLRVTSHRFGSLDEFFALDLEHGKRHEYTVAWIDCLSTGRSLGRGIYSIADHFPDGAEGADGAAGAEIRPADRMHRATVPFAPPISPVNRLTLSVMNSAYYRLHRTGSRAVRYTDWLYPLDAIGHWNRLYGRGGFHQFQCVVAPGGARDAVHEMLATTAARSEGSFLAVLKNFGDKPSPGLMSFPMPGATLALDFPNRGEATRRLLLDLYRIASDAGGRLYPAKDGCSPEASLVQGYPQYEQFSRLLDPGLSSMMARRLRLTG